MMLMNRWSLSLGLAGLVACAGSEEPLQDAGGNNTVADAGVDAGDIWDSGDGVDAGDDMDAQVVDTGTGIDPAMEPYRTIRDRGLPDNRIDIVVIGDGYTREELDGVYADHAGQIGREIFRRKSRDRDVTQPFRQYGEYISVHRIHLASNESGIDEDGMERDTALDGLATCGGGLGGGPCLVDVDKVHAAIDAALAGSGITPDWRVVILNTDKKAAGVREDPRGNIAVFPGGFGGQADYLARELALREMAKAFANADYEFGGTTTPYSGGDPTAINLTTSSTGAKWARWLGFDNDEDDLSAIGAYEGGGGFDTGLYRPTDESKMGILNTGATFGYNAVTREAIVQAFYGMVDVVTSHEDNSQPVTDPVSLWVQVSNNELVTVQWSIGERLIVEQTDQLLGITDWARINGIAAGTYTVTAKAIDDTSWVRGSRAGMEETIAWTVELTGN